MGALNLRTISKHARCMATLHPAATAAPTEASTRPAP